MLKNIFYICALVFVLLVPASAGAVLSSRLAGRIVLQVESHGEAWYVSPASSLRYYLGRPDDAFRIMRAQGIGIKDSDLTKIPEENCDFAQGRDFANKHKGKIFLAVEDKGKAWYVNPSDLHRYYLGRPQDAFAILKRFGLGISNADLMLIPAYSPEPELTSLEKRINELVNRERSKNGLKPLVYSDAIAAVAREHSRNLSVENKAFTSLEKICDLPIIHHEGLDFGFSHSERLHNRNVYDFSRSGENIALIARLDYSVEYFPGGSEEKEMAACQEKRDKAEADFKSALERAEGETKKTAVVKSEIESRKSFFQLSGTASPININNYGEEQIAEEMVASWMNSPGHRSNILNAEYDSGGIGVAYIDAYAIATQVFAAKAECGFKNGPCCGGGGCYKPMTCDFENICKE